MVMPYRRRQLLLLILLLVLIRCRWKTQNRCCWVHNWITRHRCLGMSRTLVKELTVEDGGDFSSVFWVDIEIFENLSMVILYIEKEASHLRPCVTACERLHITLRYQIGWRRVLFIINTTGVTQRQNTQPSAARIATILSKKHNMSSFLRIFSKKFRKHGSRCIQPCDARTTRPYYPALQNGRHTGG